MGSEEAALLAAVLEDPDDDLPRLALADWWEGRDGWEGGDQRERAEFVRVQCELGRWDWGPHWTEEDHRRIRCECDGCALRRREGELHWSPYLWAPAGPRWHDAPAWGFGWRRGFIYAATCTASRWLEHGDLLLAAQPVEEVTLTTLPGWQWVEGQVGFSVGPPSIITRAGWRNALGRRWPRVRHWHLPRRVEPARTHGAPWQVPLDSWQWW